MNVRRISSYKAGRTIRIFTQQCECCGNDIWEWTNHVESYTDDEGVKHWSDHFKCVGCEWFEIAPHNSCLIEFTNQKDGWFSFKPV